MNLIAHGIVDQRRHRRKRDQFAPHLRSGGCNHHGSMPRLHQCPVQHGQHLLRASHCIFTDRRQRIGYAQNRPAHPANARRA